MIRPLIGVALMVLFQANLGRGQSVDEVLSKLQKNYDSVRDLYAEFRQDVTFAVTQHTQTFSGKMWMKKGKKYRIELEQQTIVTDGKSVWTYFPLNQQVLIDSFREDPRAITPDQALVNVPRDYYSTIIGKERIGRMDHILLKLIPKDEKSLIKSMKVWVDPSQWLMRKVEVIDVSDTQTTYTTKDVRINTGLADTLFQFEIPPDVEVVDLRSAP